MNDCVSHPYIGKGDAGYSLESAHIAACSLRFEGLDHGLLRYSHVVQLVPS